MVEATAPEPVDEAAPRSAGGPWRIALRRLLRKKVAVVSLVLIGLFYAMGLFAPVLAPQDYRDQDLDNPLAGPTLDHPLGTDRLGRDLLSRVIVSARTTMIVTVATIAAGSLILAVGLGLLSGYAGGIVDTAIMRGGEIIASLPGLPMLILINVTMRPRAEEGVAWLESLVSTTALEEAFRSQSGAAFVFLVALSAVAIMCAIAAVVWLIRGRTGPLIAPAVALAIGMLLLFGLQGLFATPGADDYFIIFGALAAFSWVGGARVIRSQVLALRETEYVIAARAMGGSTGRILWSHLLPNVMPIVVVSISAGLGAIAGTEIALSFLGIGVHEPTPSFGQLIYESSGTRTLTNHLHLLLGPAIIVGVLMFAFNLLGDAINDVLTPRAR